MITDTRLGKLFLQAFASAQPYLPYGIIVTTEAAENMLGFVVNTEGPKGARLALGPCVCQYALNRWKEPVKKDLVVLYGADIYYHLDMGYELVTVEEAKSMLRECHKAGLVHGIEFCLQSGKWAFVICSCDTEICMPPASISIQGSSTTQGLKSWSTTLPNAWAGRSAATVSSDVSTAPTRP
jgi:hypothetical protein